MIGDRHGTDGGITIHQDVRLLLARLDDEQDTSYAFEKGRGGFLQVTKGWITLNGESLKEGDGADITDVDVISIEAKADDTEVLLFDLA